MWIIPTCVSRHPSNGCGVVRDNNILFLLNNYFILVNYFLKSVERQGVETIKRVEERDILTIKHIDR